MSKKWYRIYSSTLIQRFAHAACSKAIGCEKLEDKMYHMEALMLAGSQVLPGSHSYFLDCRNTFLN